MTKVFLLDEPRVEDRLSVCFGHFPNWRRKKVVKDLRAWVLERLKDKQQFCYVAYENEEPAGFVEFLPIKDIQEHGLNPCRMSPLVGKYAEYKGKQLVSVPYPNPTFTNDVFIGCLWVKLPFTGKGLGKALVERLILDILQGKAVSTSKVEGIQVYIEKRKRGWHPSIDWPAGSAAFYEKMGFTNIRDVKTTKMTGWVMRKTL